MSEIEIKQSRVKKVLESKGLDGLLMSKQSNLAWFTGGKANDVIRNNDISLINLYITPEKRYLISTSSDTNRMMEEELSSLGFEPVQYNWYNQSPFDAINTIKQGSKVGADMHNPGAEFLQPEISDIRRQLTDMEVRRFTDVAIEYSSLVTNFCKDLKPGLTERELASRFEELCSLYGYRLPVLMVGADERAYDYRHPVFRDKKIKKHFILATVGEKHGLNTPMSRVVHFGKAPEELKARVGAVNFVEASAAAASLPGRKLKEVFEVIKDAYEEMGFPGEWKNHTQGGITSYKPCEFLINETSDITIRTSETLSYNPTIAGVKTEDIYLTGPDRVVQISIDKKWPFKMIEVGGHKFLKTDILEI
jgi:Xaa-Pro aminopeptidase